MAMLSPSGSGLDRCDHAPGAVYPASAIPGATAYLISDSLAQLLPLLGHEVEEGRDRGVLGLVLRRGRSRAREVAERPLVVDRHVAHVPDVLRRFLRLVFGVEQVAGAGEDQDLRLDRLQRLVI